ncbi:MAG: hypothetical protein WB949_02610 [Candidatus Acidiferrales bacterium]
MMGNRIFLMLAAGALLLLPFADCMSAMTPEQQTMKCCGSMPCTPAHHSQGCCKETTSPQTPNMLPARHISLHVPTVSSAEYARMLEVIRPNGAPTVTINAQQYSPPELYTLNASLLI